MNPPYEIQINGHIYRLAEDTPSLPVPVGIPLPDGNFKQIEHDYQAKDGLQRIGMPEVLSLSLNQYCDLNYAWQWFWFRQMVHAFTGYRHWNEKELTSTQLSILKGKWRSLTKKSEAFTNFRGTDNCKDYVTPNSLTEMAGTEPLACGGNIVKVIGNSVRIAGKTVVPIETLDGNMPPPDIAKVNRLTRPDLIPCATNAAANKSNPKEWKPIVLSDGTYRVDNFPQISPTPFILRTNGKDAQRLLRDTPTRPAGTYTRDGIYYAINYIQESRLMDIQGTVVPKWTNP
jgi:hypothetical protein